MAKKSKPVTKKAPRVDPQIEQRNLDQKLRLRYLLQHYAPTHLSGMGVELFRRLRLGDVFEVHDPDKTEQNSEKGFEKKTTSRGKRWVPNEMALKWINEGQFKQWIRIKEEPNYRPERGFDKRGLRRTWICDCRRI